LVNTIDALPMTGFSAWYYEVNLTITDGQHCLAQKHKLVLQIPTVTTLYVISILLLY